ncbi:hypothetical protein HMPREF1984_02187 [Leptotrichia sp. oral taxon 215 str. W9775]|nr:hypothetical protein HMPREF1984_02187 [Leptotrichia sp. oral taxon 215 str. W9775]
MKNYRKSLEEIKNWLNDKAKKYLEKNFEQKDLKVYCLNLYQKFIR